MVKLDKQKVIRLFTANALLKAIIFWAVMIGGVFGIDLSGVS